MTSLGPLTFDTTPSGGSITIDGAVTVMGTTTGAFTLHAENTGGGTGIALNNTLFYSGSGALNITTENGNILTSAANTSMLFQPPIVGAGGNVTISSPLSGKCDY